MYSSDSLEVWNLTPGIVASSGAQSVFNVVGRVKKHKQVAAFVYQLNDGPERPIVFNATDGRQGRLQHPGDFNIDTIASQELQPENRLYMRLVRHDGTQTEHEIPFLADHKVPIEPRFRLVFDGVQAAEQVGQVVDGHWRIAYDESGEPCLELPEEESGYDRIILFGARHWSTGYEIKARLSLNSIVGATHHAGLLFKWNSHKQGDGTELPTQWSTGLAYYVSNYRGLVLRYGVDVHFNSRGEKVGSYLLAQRALSRWRHQLWQLLYATTLGKRVRNWLPLRQPISQMILGKPYFFRLRLHPDEYRLTVWPVGKREPAPQLVVPHPVQHLATGAPGVIAYQSAIRIYDYEVTPLH